MTQTLRVLVVGSGGREHALAWKLSQSPLVEAVYVAPGNGGTAEGRLPKISNVSVKSDDYPGLVKFAQEKGVNLVVPGPEAPLVDGIQGYFQAGEFTLQTWSLVNSNMSSWHPLLWPVQGCCPHGGIQGVLQGLYAPP